MEKTADISPNGDTDCKTAFEEGGIRLPENSRNKSKIYMLHLLKAVLYGCLSIPSSGKRFRFREKAKKHLLKSFKRISISADKSNEIRINNDSYLNVAVNVNGKNNKIIVCSADGTGKVNIDVAGDDNLIFIGEMTVVGRVDIQSYCSGGEIVIRQAGVINSLTVCNGYKEHYNKIKRGRIFIGRKANIRSCFISNPHSNACINIGDGCMFSDDVSVRNTDGHPIYDVETKECLNKVLDGNSIDIGDRVWMGLGATVLKNAKVPDCSVVGTHTVVTGQFSEPNVIIAGVPAKIVKRNTMWTPENDDFFSPIGSAEQ